MTEKSGKVFAFDIGTSSLGICVRQGKEIKKLDSLLIPNEYASTKEAAMRRRMIRTRLAHHKRENWWRSCAKEAGIEVMETRQPIYDGSGRLIKHAPDPRMLREFSAAGDETVYNSAVLRIALLQGRKLEGWQVFKAVWSAFQHRGFMPASELPWAKKAERNVHEDDEKLEENSAKQKKEEEDEAKNTEAAKTYFDHISGFPPDCQFPCYYEAERMGLWSPKSPSTFKLRHEVPFPGPARNKGEVRSVAPRSLVEKEIKLLLQNAARLFPKLKGKESFVMYGEPGIPFASVAAPKEWGSIRGKEKEAEGILGQKTPRFDNRAVDQCCLIPRLNVCKAKSPVIKELRFLLSLKNIRYSYGDKPDCALDPEQLRELFDGFVNNVWPQTPPANAKAQDWKKLLYPKGEWKLQFHITPTQWHKWVEFRLCSRVNPAHPAITKPKVDGRAAYCRPAAELLKELLLSGKAPRDFYSEKAKAINNSDLRAGLIKEDLEFLKEMGGSWYGIYIPDNRLKDARTITTPAESLARINEIINDVRNPVVRHRLHYLVTRLQSLRDMYGVPDKIVFEFIREDFMGEKAKLEYEQRIRKNQKEKDIAFAEAEKLGLRGQGLLKMRLWREQNGVDYYETGESNKIAATEVEACEIDHIVPRSKGGCDAFYNFVLTKHAHNQNKGDRTPYQWVGNTPAWDSLTEKVSMKSCGLSERKKKILLASEPEKLIEKYTTLAETAYIAKLAQKITSLFFAWPESVKGAKKHIAVSNGSQTARIRRQYKLDRLLHPDISSDDEFVKLVREGKLDKKNRANPRHHAMDALVISMQEDLEINQATGDYVLPDWFHQGFVKEMLDKVAPVNVRFQKPVIAQTIYGMRKVNSNDGTKYVAVTTAKTSNSKPTRLDDWGGLKVADAKKRVRDIYSEQIRADFELELSHDPSQEEWTDYVKNYKCKNGTRPRKISYIEARGIEADSQGLPPRAHGEIFEARKKSMPGQYIKDLKEHKGQLVYKNEKGHWIVEPVYVWESLYIKRNSLGSKYGTENVRFFRSGQLVTIKKPCKVPVGIYKLSTIYASGPTSLVQTNGVPFPSKYNIGDLIEDGGLESAQPEK